MSQPSRRRLRIETNGETGRVRDDCVFQWVNIRKGPSFTYNTGWQIYAYQKMAFLRLKQGGIFKCNTVWQLYV